MKELGCFRDPQGDHLQSWRCPFSLDICDLWAMAARESKLNTSNRRHFHLRKMRCFFSPLCERVHVFRIQLRLQGRSENVFVYRWSAMCVSATADIYNNVAHGFFILWQTNNAQRSYKNLQTEDACANEVPRIKRLTFLSDDTMLVVGPHSVNILKHSHPTSSFSMTSCKGFHMEFSERHNRSRSEMLC